MIDWPDTSDIRHDFILTYTRNHDSYMTGVSLDSQREYYGGVFDAWLRKVKADTLREAAGEVRYQIGTEASGHTSTYSVRHWLNERANQIQS